MTKYRLPMAAERCVQEARSTRSGHAAEFERELRVRGDTLTCKKGCSHCCYNPIYISVLEGISLFRWLTDNRMWSTMLRTKFEEAHHNTYGLTIPVWLLSQTPCPLLDQEEGTCTAYEGRPLTCRVTASTGDPFYCHPHRIADAGGIVPRSEVLAKVTALETAILRRLRTKNILLPLATAVLFGEKISKGDYGIEDYTREALMEHLELG